MIRSALLAPLSSALAITLVLSACSSSGGGVTTTSRQSPATNGGSVSPKEPVTIEFATGADSTGEKKRSIDRFNQSHKDIQIKYVELPQVPNDQLTRYSTWFNSKSSTPDLLMTDVTWPKMFAAAGWITPLDEFVDKDYLSRFFPSAVDVANIDGKHYGIEGNIDVGLMYYRKDLLEKYGQQLPKTWKEMENVSKIILQKENDPNLVGYVFQGAKIEGATINWLEFLWGLGGDINDSSGKIKVDTPQGIEAMKTMDSLVHGSKISPVSVANSSPNDNAIVFGNGNAIFMRNWPNQYSNLASTKSKDKYDVAPIPYSDGFASHASTGGWVYAINSNSKHKKEAFEAMKFFLSDEEQKSAAMNSSMIPSVRKVFDDSDLVAKQPIFKKLPQFLESAKSRPALRSYEQFSRALQTQVNLVLNGQKSSEQGMKDAQAEIDKIKE